MPATPLTTGKHTWQVEAVDRAGQTTRSRVRTLRIDATAPTLKVTVSGKRVAGAGAEDPRHGRPTAAAPGSTTSPSTTATSRRRRARARRAHRYKRGTFTLKVAAVDKAGNVTRKEVRAADQEVVILRAGQRRLELGSRPLLMGILNATPDSFSEERGEEALAVRLARGRALIAAGADIVDVGGESARGDRPAVSADVEIARVAALVGELVATTCWCRWTRTRSTVAEAAVAAGAGIVNDVSGLRDPGLAEVCARSGRGAGAHAHRGRAEGDAARSGDV